MASEYLTPPWPPALQLWEMFISWKTWVSVSYVEIGCFLFFCLFLFGLFRAAPVAHGISKPRSWSCSSWQHWILNPLSKARDGTQILTVPDRFVTAEPQWELHL